MENAFVPYKPKWSDLHRYSTFMKYLKEYVAFGDFKSVGASLNYVLANKLPQKEYITQSRMGKFWIRKGTNDFQYVNYTYEKHVKKYILKHIDSFDVFIDVGACIGEYCIWLSHFRKRCIAFEPVNFKAIEKNIQLNNKQNLVTAFPFGLGSKKEKVYFNILSGATGSSFVDRKEVHKESNVQIECFDDWTHQLNIKETDRVLMKVDTEGMEEEVFEGAQNFLRNHKNITIIYEQLKTRKSNSEKVLRSFANFQLSNIDEANLLAIKMG